jgi:hypothetical protein
MAPPADVAAGAKVLEVIDRSRASGLFVNEGFKLGDYAVAGVDRDWKRSSSAQMGSLKGSYTSTGYRFDLKRGDLRFVGECGASVLEKSVKILGGELGDARNKLSCECREGEAYAMVEMQGTDMDALEGELKTPRQTLAVKAVNKTDKKAMLMGAVGYRFDGEGGAYAAVETLHPGRIWLTPRVQPEDEMGLVCALAGLMLYQDPGEK